MNEKRQEEIKKHVGYAAADLVENGMLVGLGTGSTVFHFIDRLIKRKKEGLTITVVSSSIRSQHQAKQGALPFANIETLTSVDLTVDGADEINKNKEMIKGRGGALFREKILASISKKMLVIVDESKVVGKLGKQPLAVEILPFAPHGIIENIRNQGFKGSLRMQADQRLPYRTDNGNFIYDIHFDLLREDPQKDETTLLSIPGVLETGLFLNQAGEVFIGKTDGTIEVWA